MSAKPSKVLQSAEAKRRPPAAGIGRKKGVPNKTTALLKDAILHAAERAGGKAGLVGYLTEQATQNPGPFLALLGKVLPIQHAGHDGGALKVAHHVLILPAKEADDTIVRPIPRPDS